MKRLSLFLLIALLVTLGGCSGDQLKETVLTPWEDWVKNPVDAPPEGETVLPDDDSELASGASEETIPVALYYLKDGNLSREVKEVTKVEGIARRTLQELFKTPVPSGYKSAFPAGVRLNDINLKPDGTCIVDLSTEILQVKDEGAKDTAISALTRTLGQFPTISQVVIIVNGEEAPEWSGPWQVGTN